MPAKMEKDTPDNDRKPPVEYRFKKGKSGNPSGRPRRDETVRPGDSIQGDRMADRIAAMAIKEAMRTVTVEEGNTASNIPAMQGVFRVLFRAAADGDLIAAGHVINLFALVESTRSGPGTKLLQASIELQRNNVPALGRRDGEHSHSSSDTCSDPDDVLVDLNTGRITINGSTCIEQTDATRAIRKDAINGVRRYFHVEAALKADPTDLALKQEFETLKRYRELIEQAAERNVRLATLRSARRGA